MKGIPMKRADTVSLPLHALGPDPALANALRIERGLAHHHEDVAGQHHEQAAIIISCPASDICSYPARALRMPGQRGQHTPARRWPPS
jgi:hypothetical protein